MDHPEHNGSADHFPSTIKIGPNIGCIWGSCGLPLGCCSLGQMTGKLRDWIWTSWTLDTVLLPTPIEFILVVDQQQSIDDPNSRLEIRGHMSHYMDKSTRFSFWQHIKRHDV